MLNRVVRKENARL